MKKNSKFTQKNTQKRNLKFVASVLLIGLLILTLIIGFNFIDNKFNNTGDLNLSLIEETDSNNIIQKSDDILDMIEYHKYDEYLVKEEELKIDENYTENVIENIVAKYEDDLNILQAKEKEIDNLTTSEYEEITRIVDNNNSKLILIKEDVREDVVEKAKLVIIMDDISFGHQVKDVEALNLSITLSFLPPNTIHPKTSLLAKNINEYMVHLPLEALRYPNKEDNTLNVEDNETKIESRIKEIREWFPKAKYINNHTGSKFTADKEALKKLFKILDKYEFKFIDSRTTPKTKVQLVSKEFDLKYIRRDVFLDNKADVEYIKEQLKKAVKKAKKKGIAIAICHPRKTTIEALRQSSEILKEIELINMDKLNL